MNNNIEQLKTEVDDIKKSLSELKSNVDISETEKKTKAEALKAQAETTKQKIQKEINDLSNQSGQGVESKKEEAEALLNSFNEIMSLYDSITNTGNNAPIQQQTLPETESKGVFSKAKDRIGDQRSDVWNKEKWKTEGGMNLLRTVGFAATGVGAVSLAYKGIKKLFGWGKNEEEEDDEEETKPKKKKKKKPFWDRWYGKALKYSIIGTPIYYVTHGLMTNKWNILDMFDRNKKNPDATSSAENQVEATEELKEKDPEKFEKYKKLGENVDEQYNQLMDKEIKDGWGGMSIADGYKQFANKKISFEDFKATVPICMDNQFGSVSNILSEGGYYAYLREKDIKEFTEMFTTTATDSTKKLLTYMVPFLNNLTSFQGYKDKNTGDIFETVKKRWTDGEPTERCKEMNLFFRQYAKVLNYLQEKRIKLVHDIAEKKFKIQVENGNEKVSNFSTVEDAINDEEWFKTYIESEDDYKNFMNGSIIESIKVMEKNSTFDSKLSDSTENIKKECDEERAKILEENKDGHDVLDRLRENKGSLTKENCKEGESNVDKILEDIEESFDEDMSHAYFSFAHVATNSDERNRQEFLKESGLGNLKNQLKSKLQEYKNKFNKQNISGEEVDQYISSINTYFAVKKEVRVATLALQTMKSNDPSVVNRILYTISAAAKDIGNAFLRPVNNLVNGEPFDARLATQVPLTFIGLGALSNKRWLNRLGRNGFTVTPAGVTYRGVGNITRRINNFNTINKIPDWMLLHSRYNIVHGDELLLQDLLEGKISGIKAENIVRKGKSKWKIAEKGKVHSLEEFVRKMTGELQSLSERHISDLYKTRVKIGGEDVDICFMKNESIRNKILELTKTDGRLKKPIKRINGYNKRYYDYSQISVNAQNLGFKEFFGRPNGNGSKINNLTENQAKLFKRMVEGGKFTEPKTQLKKLLENIDKIDLTDISEENLIKLANELCNDPSDMGDLAKIQNRVDNLRSRVKPKPTIPEARLNEPVFGELDNTKKELDDLLKNETNQAKKLQIQNQISQIEDFKSEIGSLPEDEFKRINSLVDCFKSNGTKKTLNEVITEVTKLKKIMDAGNSLVIDESGAMKVFKSIDQIIMEFNSDALRQAKKFHPEIANELEDIAKLFEQIKLKNVSHILGNADDILRGVKFLLKLAKVA